MYNIKGPLTYEEYEFLSTLYTDDVKIEISEGNNPPDSSTVQINIVWADMFNHRSNRSRVEVILRDYLEFNISNRIVTVGNVVWLLQRSPFARFLYSGWIQPVPISWIYLDEAREIPKSDSRMKCLK